MLWVATGFGLELLSSDGIREYEYNKSLLAINYIIDLEIIDDHMLWVATDLGVLKIDTMTDEIIRFAHFSSLSNATSSSFPEPKKNLVSGTFLNPVTSPTALPSDDATNSLNSLMSSSQASDWILKLTIITRSPLMGRPKKSGIFFRNIPINISFGENTSLQQLESHIILCSSYNICFIDLYIPFYKITDV